MTPHAQEPAPVHSNRIGLHGQRGAPGLAVFCASHTVVLDGSLFEKEQGGHTFGHGPHGTATLGYSNRSQRRRRTNTVPPSRLMEPMPQ